MHGLARVVLLVGLLSSTLVAGGNTSAAETSASQVTQLGVLGDARRFARITGQRSIVGHSFIGMHQPRTIGKLLERLRPVPMLAIKTGGIVSPLDIAEGRADAFLLELNRVVAAFGARVYVRPMPEMNGAWNEYCAFNRDGSSRGPRYSTAAFGGHSRGSRCSPAGERPQAERCPAEARRTRRRSGSSGYASANGLEPAGVRESRHPRELRERVLPGRRVRRCRRERPLRPAVQCGVGCERGALRIPSQQAVRDRRVGPLGNRRPAVRRAHGRFRAEPFPGGVPRVLQRQAGLDLGPPRPSHGAAPPTDA